ncbi:MAG TPA: Stk1 family PASTA domain-containing Ser/Thr kinase, partial [Nakamurella sp.]|nr:Stk1 family PASTA domain-containing Ser/Thr kinase [Nakamurella sp.]
MTETGYLVAGRYHIADIIAVGDMSEVHRGRDLRLGRDVAVKILRADLTDDPSLQARFRREAQNAASLNHPAIVAVYDTGVSDGDAGPVPFIVMEYVDGKVLREVLDQEGPLAPQRAVEIIADICSALDFSHRRGIVHRDIRPANVMLNSAGAVKVMDFGVARSVAEDESGMTAVARMPTVTGSAIGSAHYLSPEQARGESVDARSDVYATGCVLYELLTGTPPFTGDSPVAIARRHVREAPRPPSEVRPELPPEVDAIVLKAMHKEPFDRYQSAAEMRADLRRALAGQQVQALLPDPMTAEGQRTELMRAAPPVSRGGGSPPLLAPPVRSVPAQEPERDRTGGSRRVVGFVGIAVFCVVLLVGAVWLTLGVITAPPPPAMVAMPDLSGMSLAEATTKIQDSRLTPGTVTPVDSTDANKDKVVGQRPSSQTQVAQASVVNLEIGKGVSLVTVPDVLNASRASAQQALAAVQLQYQEVLQPSSDADKGKALSEDPPADTQVPPNSTITVSIGTGLTIVTVPDRLVGASLDQAAASLAAANLTAVPQEADGVEPANQVIGIDVQPGQQVPAGSPVTLRYSNNGLMVMPNLLGQSRDQAVSTLQAQGWAGGTGSLGVTEQPTSARGSIGAVLSQNPPAGSPAKKTGTPVSVAVGARQVTVPDVVGKTQQQAATLLAQAGATNVSFTDAGKPPSGRQAGRVQAQSVKPATAIGP